MPPHPHAGLQTVSWLFEGEILHGDSVGSVETVRPCEPNLMTAGRGISHSEQSPAPRPHGRVPRPSSTTPSSLAYLLTARTEIALEAIGVDDDARLVLIGGVPFGEEIVMWWNFVGRSHDEIVAARAEWQAGLASGGERFGRVEGFDGPPLPAPELPNLRLRPRG